MLPLLPALYLGWRIGANDAANTFGPQIGANIIALERAMRLAALFALIGALVEGPKVFPTLTGLTSLSLEMSVVAALAAGITMHVLTARGLPVSSSHSIFGALIAVGLFRQTGFDTAILLRIAVSLVTAPVGAAVIAYVLYRLLGAIVPRQIGMGLFFQTTVRYASIAIGAYAAYALGANNVGNAVAPFVGVGLVGPRAAALIGGAAIAGGVLTYSRGVILTVGKQITALDPVSALTAMLGAAVTVHLFTQLHIPVSTSQAVVGAVVGVGLTKGMVAVNRRMFWMISAGWVISIAGSGAVAYGLIAAAALLR